MNKISTKNNNIYLLYSLLLGILLIVPACGEYAFGKKLGTGHSIHKLFNNKRNGLSNITASGLSRGFIGSRKDELNRKPKQLAIFNRWHEIIKKNRNVLPKLQQTTKKIFPPNPTKRKDAELKKAISFLSSMEGGLDFLDSLLKADFLVYTFGTGTQIEDIKALRDLIYQEKIQEAYEKAGKIDNTDMVSTEAEAAQLSFAQKVLLNLQLAIAKHETEKPRDTRYQPPNYAEPSTTETKMPFLILRLTRVYSL